MTPLFLRSMRFGFLDKMIFSDTDRYHYHVTVNPQVTNLLLLVTALVTNLGYLRPRTTKDRRQPLMEDVEDPRRVAQDISLSPGSERREQWRAVAGCFSIISVLVLPSFA